MESTFSSIFWIELDVFFALSLRIFLKFSVFVSKISVDCASGSNPVAIFSLPTDIASANFDFCVVSSRIALLKSLNPSAINLFSS